MGILVLGIDGLGTDGLKKFSNMGYLRTINFLAERYTKATAKTCFPPQTVPTWTSIFTGVNPGKHGVFGFFSTEKGETRLCSSLDVKFPYIFEILSMHKRSVLVYNVPLAYPFRILYGVGIPDWLTGSRKAVIKHEKKNLIEDVVGKIVLLTPLLRNALGWRRFAEIMKKELRLRRWILEGLLEFEFLENYFIVLSDLDWIMHSFYHTISRGRIPDFLRGTLEEIDRLIESIIRRAMKRNMDIIIVSDHGFKTYNKVVFVNTILNRLGLASGFTIRRVSDKMPVRKLQVSPNTVNIRERTLAILFNCLRRIPLSNNIHKQLYRRIMSSNERPFVDPDASVAFALLNVPAFFININERLKNRDKYTNLVVTLLSRVRDKKGRKVFGLVATRNDVYWGAYTKRAPDICIFGNVRAGYITSPILTSASVIHKVTNYHDFDATFIAKSESIPRESVHLISIYDIVPSIYALLEMPIQKGLDGKNLANKEGSYINYVTRWKIACRVH